MKKVAKISSATFFVIYHILGVFMPRKPRKLSSTGIYHVVLRSVNQHIIFEEDSDYQKYLYILSDCKDKYDIDILAYCLMDNHIHLLIYSPLQNISRFFQSLGTRFARWYNDKYERYGHLFQERFHSNVIESDSHYFAALVYIHNNPVKAGICRFPSEYRWSSYLAFFGQRKMLVNVDFSYQIFGSKESLLKDFAKKEMDSEIETYFETDHPTIRRYLSDDKALEIFYSITNLSNTSETVHLPKTQRNIFIKLLIENGLSKCQVARLMDVSVTTIKRICKVDP